MATDYKMRKSCITGTWQFLSKCELTIHEPPSSVQYTLFVIFFEALFEVSVIPLL